MAELAVKKVLAIIQYRLGKACFRCLASCLDLSCLFLFSWITGAVSSDIKESALNERWHVLKIDYHSVAA